MKWGVWMAKYTTQLRHILEMEYDLDMKSYPIFDETYRESLNNKIFEHFAFREIGLETPQLFKRFLNRKMNEIMPYYNQLYESTLHDYDPLLGFEVETNSTGQGESSSTGAFHDTPMGILTDPLDGKYATTMNADKNNSSNSGKSIQKGRSESAQELIKKLRASFINVDMLIIEELDSLFMSVY